MNNFQHLTPQAQVSPSANPPVTQAPSGAPAGGGTLPPEAEGKNFKDLLNEFSPEQLEQMLAPYLEELRQNESQQTQAQAMIDTPTPQGMDDGKNYVAASPMAHIGAGVQRMVGQYKQHQKEAEYAEMLRNMQSGTQQIASRIE